MTNVFVHSGYERKENDDYQTIDHRCIDALVESIPELLLKDDRVVDFCGSHGSGIVTRLNELGIYSEGAKEAFTDHGQFDWIISNPPYDRKVVDDFANHALNHLEFLGKQNTRGVAFLMRANWDFAACRQNLFDRQDYMMQIRMRFRPWWSEERTAQPIHNYVWHVWYKNNPFKEPVLRYWNLKPIVKRRK